MSSSDPTENRLSLAEVDSQLRSLSGADWKRAMSLARLCAAGLVGWTGETLLVEAIAKLCSGDRIWRPGVHPLVTLKLVMRSIASNTRKKEKNGPIDQYATVDVRVGDTEEGDLPPGAQAENSATPEEVADGRSQIRYLETLVVGDEDVEMVVMVLAEGLKGKEAAQELGFDTKRYEAAYKRLMRRLEPLKAQRKTA